MTKKFNLWIALIALVATVAFTSCDDKGDDLRRVPVTFTVYQLDEAAGYSTTSQALQVTNITTAQTTTYTSLEGIILDEGLYTFSYDADLANADGNSLHIKAYSPSVEVTSSSSLVALRPYIDASADDFIISEIFYTGTLRTSGNQYTGDQYITIYNNTDRVLYADGLSFVESKFLTTSKTEYTPNIMSQAMTVDAIYTIPGNGRDYAVQPGESMVLALNAMDHTTLNENSFDLSESVASFEFYDESNSPSNMDIDNPNVPNLDKWYCYTNSYFILHNRGFKSYALARIPVDKETYLRDYFYAYEYILVTAAGDFPMSQEGYRLDNDWIVDAVNLSVPAVYEWNVTDPSLDRGYAACGEIDRDMNRYFKSVRRKLNYVRDGRAILCDTNNSSEDFNSNAIPSVVERQGTVLDANGTKATVITYDGVTPVQ